MIISLIVAMGKNRAIGKDGGLPWNLPGDLKHFKSITMGHTLIMGRKTYDSIGRPLPGRKTIVISTNKELIIDGCKVVHSIDAAIKLAQASGEDEVFVVGGATIYEQCLDKAKKIYLTEVDYVGDADAFFPTFSLNDWVLLKDKSDEKWKKGEKDSAMWRFGLLEKSKAFERKNEASL